MNRYTLHRQSTTGSNEAVKQGWSWPAFFFGCLWAFSRSMPGLALVMIASQLAVGFIIAAAAGRGGEATVQLLLNIAGLTYSCICGANGNGWRRASLVRRGYVAVGEVEGEGPEAAVATLMSQIPAGPVAAAQKTQQALAAGSLAVPLP